MALPRRTPPEYAGEQMSRQQRSGLSIADYCRENNISPSTFYGWNRRYKKVYLSSKERPSPLPFIEIPVKESLCSSSTRIRVTRTEIEFPAETVEHVCDALKSLLSRV